MNTDSPNSNDNGLSSDSGEENVQTQAVGTENNSREGDYAINGLCPECFNPVETDSQEYDVRGGWTTIQMNNDYCPVCGWQGLEYYDD